MGKMLTLASTGHVAAAPSTGSGNLTFLLVLVVLFGLFYFVMIRPQRSRQRRVQEMQSQIGPGQRIRTTAGMYATVIEVDGDDVTLEVAPGVNVRFMRRAIMDVIPDGTEDTGDPEAAEDAGATGPAAEAPAADGQTPAEPDSAAADAAAEPEEAEKAEAGKAARPGAAEGGSAAS